MRPWLLLLLIPLSGCFGAEEEPEAETSIWGTCPQYVAGPSGDFSWSGGDLLIDFNVTELNGFALDLYELQVSTNASMELRFYVGDKQLGVTLYEPEATAQPFVVVDGDKSVAVYLSAIDHGSEPAAGPLRITVSGEGGLDVSATAWFRVCGR